MNTVRILVSKRSLWKPQATRSLHAWIRPKRFHASGRVVRARYGRPFRAAVRVIGLRNRRRILH